MAAIEVYLEEGHRRVFASAVEWPGWIRSGKNGDLALEALAAAALRYGAVARAAGDPLPAPPGAFKVVERVTGDATTDFGAPGAVPELDRRRLSRPDAERVARLVAAAWEIFGDAVRVAPAELRRGPRGGGRDRDKIVDHVVDAEWYYARKLGIRVKRSVATNRAAVGELREAILGALRGDPDCPKAPDNGWPARYAARRIAWHALDHAWEIEERSSK